ncbi:hypothetical protein [Micromonospora rosaria]|uniref:hypothetical protein n=1 Tax=Micromonospora rosaria TaxID=47874 RepID=UPI000ACC539B|nr:hypothetical protein [Micromonospora rosaria]
MNPTSRPRSGLVAADDQRPVDERQPAAGTGDDRAAVVTALRLGWWLADAFHQVRCAPAESGGRAPGGRPDKLSNFTEMPVRHRMRMYLDGVDVALADLARLTRGDRLLRATRAAHARVAAPDAETPAWAGDLLVLLDDLNLTVLRWTMATDPRIGRAYRLGRSLADTARGCDRDPLLSRFTQRQAEISRWLAELAGVLPPYSAEVVRRSLADWTGAVRTAGAGVVPDGAPDLAALGAEIREQGERWRSVLTGGLHPRDLLDEDDYARVARNLIIRDRRLVVEATRGIFVPVLVPLLGALLAVVAVSAVAASGSPATRGAVALLGLGAGLAAIWRSVSRGALAVAGEVNRPLVDTELTVRMADRLSRPLHRARSVAAARHRRRPPPEREPGAVARAGPHPWA